MNTLNSLLVTVVLIYLLDESIAGRKSRPSDKDNTADSIIEDSMICPSCDRLYCTAKKRSKLESKCRGGVTTDICGCCPVCAKLKDEPCGGQWNYLGKCDEGLYCRPMRQMTGYPQLTSRLYLRNRNNPPAKSIEEGLCTPIPPNTINDGSGGLGSPNVLEPKCEPKCTPDFCRANPREICSAIDVVDVSKDCSGKCQHTSCMACSFVDPDPDCGACAMEDFRCIKRFSKCIKRDYCSRDKYPCKDTSGGTETGKFQCLVPKCLNEL